MAATIILPGETRQVAVIVGVGFGVIGKDGSTTDIILLEDASLSTAELLKSKGDSSLLSLAEQLEAFAYDRTRKK